jgi:anti-sigma B factor antagonist
MDISTNEMESCDIISVNGRIDSFTAPKLSDVLNDRTTMGKYNLILNLSNVDYVSSAGLRVMIDIQKTCKLLNKGELLLVSVPKRIYDTLELAGFVPLFRFFDSNNEALQVF